MKYSNQVVDNFADLNLHIQEVNSFVNMFKIALKCDYDTLEPKEGADNLEILSQKLELVKNLIDNIQIE